MDINPRLTRKSAVIGQSFGLSLPLRVNDRQIRLFRIGPSVEVAANQLAVLPLALEDFDEEF